MSDHEHSINRADSTRSNADGEESEDDEEELTEAEKKRELRKSPIGRAILRRNRDLQRRRS